MFLVLFMFLESSHNFSNGSSLASFEALCRKLWAVEVGCSIISTSKNYKFYSSILHELQEIQAQRGHPTLVLLGFDSIEKSFENMYGNTCG